MKKTLPRIKNKSLLLIGAGECRAIIGETKDMICCAEPIFKKSWCAKHAEKYLVPSPKKTS